MFPNLTSGQSNYSDTNRIILEGLIKGLEYRDLYRNQVEISTSQDSIIIFQLKQINILREAYRNRQVEISRLETQLKNSGTSWHTFVLLVLSAFGTGWIVNELVK